VRVRLPPPAPLSGPPSDTYGDRGSTVPRARRPPWGNRGAIRGKTTRLGNVGRPGGSRPLVWAERRSRQAGQALPSAGRRRDGVPRPCWPASAPRRSAPSLRTARRLTTLALRALRSHIRRSWCARDRRRTYRTAQRDVHTSRSQPGQPQLHGA